MESSFRSTYLSECATINQLIPSKHGLLINYFSDYRFLKLKINTIDRILQFRDQAKIRVTFKRKKNRFNCIFVRSTFFNGPVSSAHTIAPSANRLCNIQAARRKNGAIGKPAGSPKSRQHTQSRIADKYHFTTDRLTRT